MPGSIHTFTLLKPRRRGVDIRHLASSSDRGRHHWPGAVRGHPFDDIRTAPRLMEAKGISQLPVLRGDQPKEVMAILRQKKILTAYGKAVPRKEFDG